MKDFLHTLIKPDWGDNPKRSEILHAANFYLPYIEKRVVYPELYENKKK